MKRIVSLIFSLLLLGGLSQNAFAFPTVNTYWDLTGVDTEAGDTYFADNVVTGGDSITEAFSELLYYAETTSVIQNNAAVGAQVVDGGMAYITGLNPVSGTIPPDSEGLGGLYGMTFVWNDLTGVVDSNDGNTIEATYTSGTFDFYIDYDPYSVTMGTESTFTDGVKVATMEVTSGHYELDLGGEAGSSYLLYGKFTDLISGFWFDENGLDLASGNLIDNEFVLAYTAGDTDPQNTTLTTVGTTLEVFSPHDSSIEIGVVPEPTTFLLFGLGLLGFAGIGRKKIV